MEQKPFWPWQPRGVKGVLDHLEQGRLSVCLTSPTGMGKGRMIEELALSHLKLDGRVILFTNRKMLTHQTGVRFHAAGIPFGYLSAEHGYDPHHRMIIASVQTVSSRLKRQVLEMPRADLVLVDECHNGWFDKLVAMYRAHHPGTAVVGATATPIGLKGKYDHLVVAGTKREGRAAGALVPCRVFAPSEPDMKGVRMTVAGEYEHAGMVKRVMQCTCFADVFDSWDKHGGCGRPTLLWAPGVPESQWIVSEFRKRGVTAEHIDGTTSETDRLRIAEGSQSGAIQLVSSFGVLREGVDWPWISYGILVQVCGAIGTFLQTVGRILRASPGKRDAILQDHSGTWWRHGSPNEDVDWSLDDTNKSLAKQRQKTLQKGDKEEGVRCPQCGGVRAAGPKCPHCGYEHTRSVRMVRMESGELVAMNGPVVPIKKKKSPEQQKWTECLFRCAATGRTFAQAKGLYEHETGRILPENATPRPDIHDWCRRVGDLYPRYVRSGRAMPQTQRYVPSLS